MKINSTWVAITLIAILALSNMYFININKDDIDFNRTNITSAKNYTTEQSDAIGAYIDEEVIPYLEEQIDFLAEAAQDVIDEREDQLRGEIDEVLDALIDEINKKLF